MSWPLRKLLLSSLILGLGVVASAPLMAAEKKEEPKAEAKKEEPKEGKKEEGKEGAKEGGKEAEGKGETKKDAFAEAQNRVSTLQAKIKASEETIHKLIEEKQKTKDADAVSEIIKNMVTEHRTMQKNIEDYDQARSFLQYRFPEKGLKGERQYERIELKSLTEMESEMGIDARIKRTLHKVRKQYQAPAPRVVEVESRPDEAGDKKGKHKKPAEGSSISDPVILTK